MRAPFRRVGAERRRGRRLLAYGVLPALVVSLTLPAGYLKWCDGEARVSRLAGIESVHAATESAVAMLSYRPDSVEQDLDAARSRLTGELKDSYTELIHNVVIPGSRQKQISTVASVPAAASVSASDKHAVALLFINQTIVVGSEPPTDTASRVRVSLDKVDGRWLVAGFDPI